MNVRLTVLSIVAASASLVALSAGAHDHSKSFDADQPKPVPTTCKQLADTHHYSNDPSNPEIKALKARCDAEKKAAARP
ncbi:hypothetical protein V2S84_14015 [Azotobacter chroococcum]|nr:hypothetical protein [Azotobacter chroococcum]